MTMIRKVVGATVVWHCSPGPSACITTYCRNLEAMEVIRALARAETSIKEIAQQTDRSRNLVRDLRAVAVGGRVPVTGQDQVRGKTKDPRTKDTIMIDSGAAYTKTIEKYSREGETAQVKALAKQMAQRTYGRNILPNAPSASSLAEALNVTSPQKSSLEMIGRCIDALRELAAVLQTDDKSRREEIDHGRIVVSIYVAGASGLKALAASLRRNYPHWTEAPTIYKVGIVSRTRSNGSANSPDLGARLIALGRDRYASVAIDAWGGAKAHDGHASWVLAPLCIQRLPSDKAITLEARTIDVVLPRGAKVRAFDRALHQVLEHRALDVRFPLEARSTAYRDAPSGTYGGMTGAVRVNRARELYLVDPIREGGFLLAMVEKALDVVRSQTPSSSARAGNRTRGCDLEGKTVRCAHDEGRDRKGSVVATIPAKVAGTSVGTNDVQDFWLPQLRGGFEETRPNKRQIAGIAHYHSDLLPPVHPAEQPRDQQRVARHGSMQSARKKTGHAVPMTEARRRAMHARQAIAARAIARRRK